MTKRSVIAGLNLTCLMLFSAAHADDIDEIQRRDLALIQTQLQQINIVVDRIEARQRNSDPETTRLYFDIPTLRHDLKIIRSGIDQYLAPPRFLPRTPARVVGDYLDDSQAE